MAAQVASGSAVPPPPPPPAPPLPPAPPPAASNRPPAQRGSAAPMAGPGPGSKAAGSGSRGAAPGRQSRPNRAQVKGKPAPPAPAARPPSGLDSRLRRDTPFICSMRFKTDLPEIPADPKMLVAPLRGDQLGSFFISSMEHEPRRDLVLAPDLGIPIALMDIGRYDVQEGATLDPADAALLAEDAALRAPVKNDSPLKVKRFAAKNAEVSWLMRTTYISSHDAELRKRTTQTSRHQPLLQDEETSREKQLAMIEATFEAARRPPKHPKDPKLHAVQIMPLLPDFERWSNKHVRVQFDSDPTEESEALAKVADPALRHALAERCMFKTFRPNSSNETASNETALAMLIPQQALAAAGAGEALPHAEAPSDLEGDYLWDKEYTHSLVLQDEQQHNQEDVRYLVRLNPETGTATYCTFAGKITLRKRKRREGDDPPPAKATVRCRPYTEEELQDRRERALYAMDDDQ